MARLEDLARGATIQGILLNALVPIVDVRWYGSDAVELIYKDPAGRPDARLLYRDEAHKLSSIFFGIFPRAWCKARGIPDRVANAIVNKTPNSYKANRMIGGRAPSSYLPNYGASWRPGPGAAA